MPAKQHEHIWRIFNDPDLRNTGYLSFFCQGCLALAKIKKEYKEGKNGKSRE